MQLSRLPWVRFVGYTLFASITNVILWFLLLTEGQVLCKLTFLFELVSNQVVLLQIILSLLKAKMVEMVTFFNEAEPCPLCCPKSNYL